MVDRAFDFVSPPDPALLVGSGACFYTGRGLPDQWWFDECAHRGIPLLAIQESWITRAQEGYNAGVEDVNFARARLSGRQIWNLSGIAYAASDGSRFDPQWNGDRIADYGQAVGVGELLPFTFYGNRYAVDAASAGALRVAGMRSIKPDGGWLPSTWDFDATRDLMEQLVNSQTPIPNTDENRVWVDFFMGDDMYGDPDRERDVRQLEVSEKILASLQGINFPPNDGQRGSMQDQVGQLWSKLLGPDNDHLGFAVQVEQIVVAHCDGAGDGTTGPTPDQIRALRNVRTALDQLLVAFPT